MAEDNTIVAEALKLLQTDREAALTRALTASVGAALDKVRGESTAEVESATELTQSEKEQLAEFLLTTFNRNLTTTYTVKKDLLGGFKVRVGDWKLDTSLASRLDQMKQLLLGGVNG